MLETLARPLRQVEAAPRRVLVDSAPDLSQVPADRFRRGLRGRRPSQPPGSRLRFDLLSFERVLLNGEKAPPRILETAPWSYLVRPITFAQGYGDQETGLRTTTTYCCCCCCVVFAFSAMRALRAASSAL